MPKSSARNFNNPGDDQKIMSSTQIQAAQQAQQPAEVTHTKGQKVGDTESPTSVEAIGTQAAEPDGPPPDPFSNLDQLRLSQDHVAALGLKKQLMTVPARKPSKEWFVRVHPDPAYRLETAVIEFKEDSEVYLVDKSLWSELAAESTFSLRLFLTGISRPGNVVFRERGVLVAHSSAGRGWQAGHLEPVGNGDRHQHCHQTVGPCFVQSPSGRIRTLHRCCL